jgi:hypothetical protein
MFKEGKETKNPKERARSGRAREDLEGSREE